MIRRTLSACFLILVLAAISLAQVSTAPENRNWKDMMDQASAPAAPPPSIAKTFTGAGLDDLTQAGTYTQRVVTTIVVTVAGTGTPNTFNWTQTGGTAGSGSGVNMSASPITLDDGITVRWAATTGHTIGNSWTIVIKPRLRMYFNSSGDMAAIWSNSATTTAMWSGGALSGSLLALTGATSGSNTFTSPTAAGTQSYTLPTGYPGTSGYALTSTTLGVMSWTAITPSAPLALTGSSDVVQSKIISYSSQTADLFQALASNGTTVLAGITAGGAIRSAASGQSTRGIFNAGTADYTALDSIARVASAWSDDIDAQQACLAGGAVNASLVLTSAPFGNSGAELTRFGLFARNSIFSDDTDFLTSTAPTATSLVTVRRKSGSPRTTGLELVDSPFVTTQTTKPTIATAGTSATVTNGSTDECGEISIVGTAFSGTTTISYNLTHVSAAKSIVLTASDAAGVSVSPYVSSSTSTTFVVNVTGLTGTASYYYRAAF